MSVLCLPWFRSFSTLPPITCQTSVDVLQPITEHPLSPLVHLSPLPSLPVSTSLICLSTNLPPSRPLPYSTSLLCLSTRDVDHFLSSDAPPSSSSTPSLVPDSSSTHACHPTSTLLSSQSPTATLQSTNTQTQSSSSSSGDGSLFRQRGSQAAQPDETGRVPPYVDFSQFYRLWGGDHNEGQSTQGGLGPQ